MDCSKSVTGFLSFFLLGLLTCKMENSFNLQNKNYLWEVKKSPHKTHPLSSGFLHSLFIVTSVRWESIYCILMDIPLEFFFFEGNFLKRERWQDPCAIPIQVLITSFYLFPSVKEWWTVYIRHSCVLWTQDWLLSGSCEDKLAMSLTYLFTFHF